MGTPLLISGNAQAREGNEDKMENCPEYSRFRSEVENVLGNLAQVTVLLLELFRSDNSEKYKHLDKELELTVGEKERAVGALRQHIKEHKCRPEDPKISCASHRIDHCDNEPIGV